MADPAAAVRLNPADTTRVARALEVVRATGRTLADWQLAHEGGIADDIALAPLILLPPRDWLRDRCDRRLVQMFERGAIAEVEALLARRSEERRVGKECVRTCRSRWSPYPSKQNKKATAT